MTRKPSSRLSIAMKYRFRGTSGGDAPTPPAAPVISNFAIGDNPVDVSVETTFTATIAGPLTAWSLDPGDGTTPYTGTGSSVSVPHTYAGPSTYTATLTATGAGGSDVATILNIVVEDVGAPVIGSFTVSNPTLLVGEQTTFEWTQSGEVTAWSLDTDGDGDADWSGTNETSRVHTYGSAQSVTPTLTISGPGGSDSEPLGSAIVVTLPPIAIGAFTVSDMTANEGEPISFDWSTTGEAQIAATLDPGDGTTPYTLTTETSQPHTFASAGTYDATLVVTAAASSDTDTIADIDVAAPTSNAWYDWTQDFTEISATNRSLSGGDKTNAPFTSLMTFHPGEVTAAHWFDADVDGTPLAANAWQLGQRTTHPDGSLASGILRAIIPGTWTDEADKQVTLTRKAGSWPAETDGRALSVVTGASDFWVELDDITRPENRPVYWSAARNDQVAWARPTLEYRNNRALALSTARTVSAGNVFRQDLSYEMLRTPDGSTADTDLWMLCYTDTWFAPGTNTVIHQSVHPLLCHGYANDWVLAKVAKIRCMNGASEVHNYTDVLNLTMADWNSRANVGEWDFTDAATDFTTFRFRVGDAVKITGDTPSNIPDGHIFQIQKTQDMGEYAAGGRAGEIQQKPYMGLCWKGVWSARGGVAGPGGGANGMPPGTGGGNHTMTSYVLILDKTIMALRDDDGSELWTVGGAQIEPCWTRAEKIRRMQTGQIPSIPIEEMPDNPATPYRGQASNTPKNTSGIPNANHLHAYGPGRTLYHRGEFNTSGVGFQQGNHLNECSLPMWDVLQDMANPDVPFWRMQKQAAAESIALVGINCFDHNTVSGNKIAQPICLNNGPAKNGVAYPGMGPCQPTGAYGGAVKARGASPPGPNQQNEMKYFPSGGESGSHSTKEMAFGYVLRCYPTDLVGIQQLWTLVHSQYNNSTSPLFGRNKTINGVSYYGAGTLGTGRFTSGQPRCFIGWNFFLSFCLYTPDSEPASQYFKDVASDSLEAFAAALADPTLMGDKAKLVGMIQSGTGNQGWVLGRHCNAGVYLLKRSGKVGAGMESVLNYLTAQARLVFGAPEGGGTPWPQARGVGYNGFKGFALIMRFYDTGKSPANPPNPLDTDPQQCVVRYLDVSRTPDDGSELFLGYDVPDGSQGNPGEPACRFNTDNTITFTACSPRYVGIAEPYEGVQVLFSRDPLTSQAPTAIAPYNDGPRLWCYDFIGLTCKLSTTPGPSYTQLTWSIGAPQNVHRNNVQLLYPDQLDGGYPDNMFSVMQNQTPAESPEYIYETTCSLPAAWTMFGAPFLNDGITALNAFAARVADPSHAGKSFYNRAENSVSWACFYPYGPGAT